jgi:hypothetical protein
VPFFLHGASYGLCLDLLDLNIKNKINYEMNIDQTAKNDRVFSVVFLSDMKIHLPRSIFAI